MLQLLAQVDKFAMLGGIDASLPDDQARVALRELIRKDQDRQNLRSLLLAGAASRPGKVADANYFDALRSCVHKSGAV